MAAVSTSSRIGMIDLHCHYLPGVDDGARTLEQGLSLVRAAQQNGIDRIVLTPHIHSQRYANTLKNLRPRFESFRRAAAAQGLRVQFALGGEARLGDELLPLIDSEQVPLLKSASGASTLLLEFPHSHIPVGCLPLIRWLQQRGITPLLAHPERNKELMAHPQRLQALLDAGCLVQITAAAVIGGFGAGALRAANFFLDKNWVTAVASDAHNLRHRPPLLREAAAAIAERFGAERALQLTATNPLELAADSFAPLLPLPKSFSASPASRQARAGEAQVPRTIAVSDERWRQCESADNKDLCNSAVTQMQSELLRRANLPGSAGMKAARILRLMNILPR